ncbi:hypothetical protein BCR34DRAFT_599644 [Clohesyomyces aquaticus]|uniref:Integral membrane protein n=1 Tax=Clohesyomyces aquaticus TaxID=1231657 RepID=A0A1Y1ZTT5_9PLEO|nr:hypothetical protein BCR34DRAFT_599644 [Clohesyomyces aquaticus]
MASGKFFDPHVLLRVSPLLTSTCSLWYAWDQHFFLSIFLSPTHLAQSNDILPSYFRVFFRGGVTRVLVLLSLTMATSAANIYSYAHRGSSHALREKGALAWYVAGAGFAAAHLLFVPAVAPRIVAISEDKSKGNSTQDLRAWLRVNAVRMLTVDLAAWGCLGVGVMKALNA